MVSRLGVPQVKDQFSMGTEYLFEPMEWISIQQDLTCVEAAMRMAVARDYGRILGDVRGGFPARRLQRRRGWRVEELRVLLDSDYFVERKVSYQVSVRAWIGAASVTLKTLDFRVLGNLRRDEVCNMAVLAEMLDTWEK